jgi:hypothetical protein
MIDLPQWFIALACSAIGYAVARLVDCWSGKP